MDRFDIYFDEDALDADLVAALRSRGISVLTVLDIGHSGVGDEEQLAWAAEHNCVVLTFNVSDFYRLHAKWLRSGRDHSRVILAPQQRFSVGEQLQRILLSRRHDYDGYAESR